jgi:membrane-associated protease RseP (regulator of RpoE activity)
MSQADEAVDGLPVDRLRSVFHLQETRTDGERVLFFGESLVPYRALMEEVWPAFRAAGYDVELAAAGRDEDVLVAEPHRVGVDGVPWTNVVLLLATVCSTLLVGALMWYYVPAGEIARNPLSVLRAWPFSAAVLGVLLAHELGHYAAGRYHGIDISLPYVIPFFIPFGTLGAVIRMRGQVPSRRALFDVGVAGPLAGLAATVVVTVVGLSLDPIPVPGWVLTAEGQTILFRNPPLLEFLAGLLGEPTSYDGRAVAANPVVMAGWLGMFFTVLNLLPVGQLDGGHVLRAMVGERQETIAALVPLGLFGLAGYLHYVRELSLSDSVGLWLVWGVLALLFAYRGSANPLDETAVDSRRLAVGVLTFLLGALCFLLVPIKLGV